MMNSEVLYSAAFVGLTRAAMLVYMNMCAEAMDYACVQIARAEIKDRTGLNFRTISRGIDELALAGFVRLKSRPSGDVPIYEILIRL